jgi:hypothetical protein
MACLRNQQRAAAAAARNGIAPSASQPPRLRTREVAKTMLRYNLQQYYRMAYLLGRHPRLTKGDTAAILLGSALSTAVIMARLRRRQRFQAGIAVPAR